jgi:hypothetical protein
MAEGSARGGECAATAWYQPKPPHVRHGLWCTIAAARDSDRRSLRRLGVRAWAGFGTAELVARGRHRARERRCSSTVSISPF